MSPAGICQVRRNSGSWVRIPSCLIRLDVLHKPVNAGRSKPRKKNLLCMSNPRRSKRRLSKPGKITEAWLLPSPQEKTHALRITDLFQ